MSKNSTRHQIVNQIELTKGHVRRALESLQVADELQRGKSRVLEAAIPNIAASLTIALDVLEHLRGRI